MWVVQVVRESDGLSAAAPQVIPDNEKVRMRLPAAPCTCQPPALLPVLLPQAGLGEFGLPSLFLDTTLTTATSASTSPPSAHPPPGVQEEIKTHITDLMLSAQPRVRAQLSEALSIISSHDFPARWQGLLPHLIAKLGTEDMQLANGVLSTADSIFQRYRNQYMTPELSNELEYSQQLVRPLLAELQLLSRAAAELAAAGGGGDVAALQLVLSNVQLVCSTFYSLNSPGLTDVRACCGLLCGCGRGRVRVL